MTQCSEVSKHWRTNPIPSLIACTNDKPASKLSTCKFWSPVKSRRRIAAKMSLYSALKLGCTGLVKSDVKSDSRTVNSTIRPCDRWYHSLIFCTTLSTGAERVNEPQSMGCESATARHRRQTRAMAPGLSECLNIATSSSTGARDAMRFFGVSRC